MAGNDIGKTVEDILINQIIYLGGHPEESVAINAKYAMAIFNLSDAIDEGRVKVRRKLVSDFLAGATAPEGTKPIQHAYKMAQSQGRIAEFLKAMELVPERLQDHANLAEALEKAKSARTTIFSGIHPSPNLERTKPLAGFERTVRTLGPLHPETLDFMEKTCGVVNSSNPGRDLEQASSHLSKLARTHKKFLERHEPLTHLKK
jgi:hypothetical protein